MPILLSALASAMPRTASLPDSVTPDSGTRVLFRLRNVTVRLAAGVSASPIVKATGGKGVPSTTEMSAIGVIVGGVFGATVTMNERVTRWLSAWPSSTVTVTVEVPVADGVSVNVPVVAPGV